MLDDPAADKSQIVDNQINILNHFAGIGRLSASMLHEISNPITAALLYLDQFHEAAPQIVKAKQNILLLQSYVEAARQQIKNRSPHTDFYIRDQIEEIRKILSPIGANRHVSISIERTPNYKLHGDPVKFQQILTNLIINGIDSYKDCLPTNRLRKVKVTFSNHREWVNIAVEDHGRGITDNKIGKIFDDFYTTKTETGLGLGLSSVKRWVENDYSGKISVTSDPELGTVFTVALRSTPKYTK